MSSMELWGRNVDPEVKDLDLEHRVEMETNLSRSVP